MGQRSCKTSPVIHHGENQISSPDQQQVDKPVVQNPSGPADQQQVDKQVVQSPSAPPEQQQVDKHVVQNTKSKADGMHKPTTTGVYYLLSQIIWGDEELKCLLAIFRGVQAMRGM